MLNNTKVEEKEQPILVWDTCDIISHRAEEIIQNAQDEGEEVPSEEEARDTAAEDSFAFELAWEDLVSYLTTIMEEVSPAGVWDAEVNNFGWRSLDGRKAFKADTGSNFLREILPNTDCTFHIFKRVDEDGKPYLVIRNWHHDSPMGNEYYYIRAARACEACGDIVGVTNGDPVFTTKEGGTVCERCKGNYYSNEDFDVV